MSKKMVYMGTVISPDGTIMYRFEHVDGKDNSHGFIEMPAVIPEGTKVERMWIDLMKQRARIEGAKTALDASDTPAEVLLAQMIAEGVNFSKCDIKALMEYATGEKTDFSTVNDIFKMAKPVEQLTLAM